jgi:uncharacterized protein (DUF1810 family)
MKTLLVTAASASCLEPFTAVASSRADAGSETGSPILENGEQQLRISPVGRPFSFQNFLRDGNKWKAATLPDTPLVTGPSFPLVTSRLATQPRALVCEGTGVGQGLDGKTFEYRWEAEIKAHGAGNDPPWFRFRTTLHLPAPVRLRQGSEVEPQIIVWLNSISMLMEGQSGSWRRVVLQQPTRNSLGAWGNDLPAVYMLDQNAGVETMMYFDISEMGWMSMENLPRFLVYRCSNTSHIERDGTQRLGVGLIAEQATGDVLPAGDVRFSYWLLQRPVTTLLNERQAVTRWMQALVPLFEEKLDWPSCAGAWKDFAAGTVQDLQDKNTAQVEVNGHTGLRAYVKGTSQIWQQPPDDFELMTVTDVLWPSLLYLQLHPSPAFEQECSRLLASLPNFYRADTHSISNNFRPHENERADSWYPFENSLIKYPTIGSLAGSKQIADYFLDAFRTAQKMAHQYEYLFPIYYRVATLEAEGAGTNYAVSGLYAWAALIAQRLSGDRQYRQEAERAVRALCTVPSERLFHEPQELAYGALAAAELGLHDEATYLLYEQLRMFYWYSDPSQKTHDIRGMVQAAASILYPAFKENVEAILPWTGMMKRGMVFDGLLRFMDQQRRNNFFFFEGCSANQRAGAMRFIPFENLGTLELGGQTGNVGKEIYGAGECLWMYLMFEALGQVADRELMLVNLDLLDAVDKTKFPARELNFVLYNPTAEARTAEITIPPAKGSRVRLSAKGKTVDHTLRIPAHGVLRLVAEY